jgi:hypothetical protein
VSASSAPINDLPQAVADEVLNILDWFIVENKCIKIGFIFHYIIEFCVSDAVQKCCTQGGESLVEIQRSNFHRWLSNLDARDPSSTRRLQ